MELLFRRLGARRDEIAFTLSGDQIWAKPDEEGGDATARKIRAEAQRRAIFEIISEACERAPELKSDWFAVNYAD